MATAFMNWVVTLANQKKFTTNSPIATLVFRLLNIVDSRVYMHLRKWLSSAKSGILKPVNMV